MTNLRFLVYVRCWWKRDDYDELSAAFKYRETAAAWAKGWFGTNERQEIDGRMFWYIEEIK